MTEVLTLQANHSTQEKAFKEVNIYPYVMFLEDVMEFTQLGVAKTFELLKHPKCPTIKHSRNAVYRDEFIQFYLDFIGGGDT